MLAGAIFMFASVIIGLISTAVYVGFRTVLLARVLEDWDEIAEIDLGPRRLRVVKRPKTHRATRGSR